MSSSKEKSNLKQIQLLLLLFFCFYHQSIITSSYRACHWGNKRFFQSTRKQRSRCKGACGGKTGTKQLSFDCLSPKNRSVAAGDLSDCSEEINQGFIRPRQSILTTRQKTKCSGGVTSSGHLWDKALGQSPPSSIIHGHKRKKKRNL